MSPEYSWPTTPTNASWKKYNRIITSEKCVQHRGISMLKNRLRHFLFNDIISEKELYKLEAINI